MVPDINAIALPDEKRQNAGSQDCPEETSSKFKGMAGRLL